jgi:hypothetical protein
MTVTSSLARSLALGIVLALSYARPLYAQGSNVSGPGGSPPNRQILVMLRMAPPHFRPGASYGGSYGDGEGRSARWRIAHRAAEAQGASIVNEWPMPMLGVDCFVMAVPSNRSLEEVQARLARDPAVAWVEPVHIFHGQGEALPYNDPLYRVQPAAGEWHLAELHQISTGHNVRVAIIDSMIDRDQPDLVGQLETMRNFVAGGISAPEAHGTGVAGIIAARPNNGVGIVGVAPRARLMGLRACWQDSGIGAATLCDSLSLAEALQFAVEHDAQIINMSLSGPADLLLSRLLDVALARNIAVVAAYDRDAPDGGFPASHKGVVAVIDEEAGPLIPGIVGAPGRDVPTTEPGARWSLVNGSSYAAAHVTGLLALLRERSALANPASALILTRLSDRIDACATLLQKPEPCSCSGESLTDVSLATATK